MLAASPPVRLAGPFAADVSPAVVAVSPAGRPAVGFSVFDEDQPAVSQAWLVTRGRPRQVVGAQAVLALAFSRGSPVALVASGAQALVGRRVVASGVEGTAIGRLEVLPGGRVAAAVASLDGVWVGGRRLSSRVPLALAGTVTQAGRAAFAWLTHGRAVLSWGGRPRPVLVARGGHQLDELALAPDGSGVTVAVIDSWLDRHGIYHSVVDEGRRTIAVAGQPASGLALAGDARRSQVLAFKSCDFGGRCSVWVAYGGGAATRVAPIDPSQAPDATVSRDGTAFVGWVFGGRVYAVWRGPRAGGFTRPRALTATHYAAALRLAAGPGSEAVVVWTQGTLNPSVVAAVLR